MSLLAYKVLHLLAVMFTFAALGAATVRALSGAVDAPGKKLAGMTHGIALLVVLVSGVGLLHKAGYGFPPWAIAKIVVWLVIGGSIAIVRRKPQWATALWVALPLLGGLAAWLAVYKP